MSVAEAVFGRLADGGLVIVDGGTGSQLQDYWASPAET
jgi:hypothetical protein